MSCKGESHFMELLFDSAEPISVQLSHYQLRYCHPKNSHSSNLSKDDNSDGRRSLGVSYPLS